MRRSPLHPTLAVATVMRLLLLLWGLHQDAQAGDVGYTDIDYLVFSDASRCLVYPDSIACSRAQGRLAPAWLGDPFARSTYRYTPLLAILTAPNVIFASFGKVLFASADLVVGKLLYDLLIIDGVEIKMAKRWSWLWLLNPIVAVVSTRGNAEAIVGVFVVYALKELKRKKPASSACSVGLAIHLKLYPVIYGASVVAFLGLRKGVQRDHLTYAVIVIVTVTATTFAIWGTPYIEHSLLYHLHRTDHRHNFSPFYYPFYLLDAQEARGLAQNALYQSLRYVAFVPQLGLCAFIGFWYGHDPAFAWFLQTFTFVTFNKVCTSQYFLWYLWLAPAAFVRLKMSLIRALALVGLWLAMQALWLSQAYLLEMKGQGVHDRVWLASVLFFVTNVIIIAEFAKSYNRQVPLEARKEQ